MPAGALYLAGERGGAARLGPEALADNLAGVCHHDKSVGLHAADVPAQDHRLAPGHYGKHQVDLVVGVGAGGLADGGAAVELFHNEVPHRLRVGADDVHILAQVKALDDVIHHHGLHQQAQDGVEPRFDAEDKAAGNRHQDVRHQQRPADIHVGVFAQQHGDNVGTAGGCPDVEEDGRAQGRQPYREDELQKGLIGKGGLHGVDKLHSPDDAGHQAAGVDGGQAEFAAEEQKGDHQQGHVDHKHKAADGYAGDEFGDNHGKAGDAAGGEVVGELEEVVSQGHKEGAEGDQKDIPGF